jgi:hypothetical protein
MGNITGRNFRTWVSKQITIRQQKLGALNKDADNLTWQTNSTAFLRLCSAVDISSTKSTELTGDTSYAGSTLAKKYVLFGGVNSDSGYWSPKEGVLGKSSDASYSFSGDDSYSSAYGFNSSAENRGLIPMPGLEGATVTPLNRGALKKAQIKIKCHSKEQFAILDALYMRPGYTILLEWGHTMYFDNEGNLVKTPEWNTPAYESLINRSGTQDDILADLDKGREESDGNYDGFYGKITNFNWAFNADGTYDITVNAISIGDVIETLNINSASFLATKNIPKKGSLSGSTGSGTQGDGETEDNENPSDIPQFIVNKNKSKLNNWLYYIYNVLGKKDKTSKATTAGFGGSNKAQYRINSSDSRFVKSFTKHQVFREIIRVNNKVEGRESEENLVDEATFIRLGSLLAYIEKYLLIYDDNSNSYINIDWDFNTNFCFTFPEHYSTDPSVCVIPFKQPFAKNGKYIQGQYGRVYEEVLGDAFRDTKSQFVGKLMAIHLNIGFIDKCISENLKEGQLALLPFLESLVGGVQRALGDINKFSVTYDGETNYVKIIDEIPLDPKVTGANKNVALFNTYGVKENLAGSFVTNVTLNATISSEFATMISIGAQARNDGKKANTSTLTAFNKGLIDGITPQKLSREIVDRSLDDDETFEDVYSDTYRKLFKRGSLLYDFYWLNKRPNADAISSEYSIISEMFRTLAAHYNRENGVAGVEGFLPFNLGLEIKGLSGPRIYERFFITGEILPESYPNNLAFLVKGLQHDINSSGWTTTIDSMAYQSIGDTISLPETTEAGNEGSSSDGGSGGNNSNLEDFDGEGGVSLERTLNSSTRMKIVNVYGWPIQLTKVVNGIPYGAVSSTDGKGRVVYKRDYDYVRKYRKQFTYTDKKGNTIVDKKLHEGLHKPLKAVLALIEAKGFIDGVKNVDASIYARDTTNAPGLLSGHSFGVAMDFNSSVYGYGTKAYKKYEKDVKDPKSKNYKAAKAIEIVAESELFYWGGDYKSTKDTHHFTFLPFIT